MYKLLLCWRYLRTRYIALASIISVTLGVATMIVVNSVMAGFTSEMQNRIHGILSDVVFEAHSLDGLPDAEWHMEQIREVAGDDIEGMTPTVVVPAMLSFRVRRQVDHAAGAADRHRRDDAEPGERFRPVPAASGEPRATELRACATAATTPATTRPGPTRPSGRRWHDAGWEHRRDGADGRGIQNEFAAAGRSPRPTRHAGARRRRRAPTDPFARRSQAEEHVFDPAKEQHTGVVLGIAMASFRTHDGRGPASWPCPATT